MHDTDIIKIENLCVQFALQTIVVEAVKGSIYRDMQLFHPMNGIMETLTEVTTDEQDTPHGKVNLELVEKISIKTDEDEEGSDPA